MPEFAPGSSHIATLPIAVAPAGLACEVELWLSPDGETKSASSGLVPFTSTGSQQDLSLAVDMPSEEGTYKVLIDIYCEGNLVGAYQALENVNIVAEKPNISIYDVFLTSNYDPPSAADNYIHARIRNDGAIAQTRQITAYYWEPWMTQAAYSTQTITIEPGQVIEYHEHFHGNDYTKYQSAVWLTGDWTEEPLTRRFHFLAGMRLSSSDPDKVDLDVHEVGSDYVVLRYMQYGACNKWEYRVYTPPVRPFEQYLKGLWYTKVAYCAYWLIPNLLPGRLYEAHCEGGTTANREDWIQFSTPKSTEKRVE